MIDKKFWKKIAENWVKNDDGISLPDGGKDPHIEDIDPTIVSLDEDIDDEIEDILADLDIDD